MVNEEGSPFDTASFVDKTYNYLLNKISEGEIKYGEVINIKKLADKLGVSTMPVREALKRLEYDSIVEIKPRSNCQVKIPTKEMMRDIFELRELIESYSLKKSFSFIKDEDLKNLNKIVAEMKATLSEKDPKIKSEKMIRLDRQFHKEIINLSKNDYIKKLHNNLILHVNMQLIHERQKEVLEDKEYIESHSQIAKFVSLKSPDVDKALRRHFKFIEDTVLNK